MLPIFNEFQTPIDSELVKSLPKEAYTELINTLETVEFASWMASNERGSANELPRDDDGKIIVDITRPHIVEDVDYFRQPAIHFKKYGRYTNITPNRNRNSEYGLFWKGEVEKWRNGLVRESDGEWIPGNFYFYLNYAPIWKVIERKTKSGKVRGDRVYEFCNFWMGDYLFYHYLEQAQENGSHAKLLKTRGVGFSYKMGSLSPCNMYTKKGLPNFHLASDKTFLEGDKGVFGKVIDTLDWIAENTPMPKLRIVDRSLEKQLGYTDEYGVKKGLKSSTFGISLKDNADKARGIRGPLIHYEEDGLFPNLEKAWNVNRKAVEDGDIVYGLMLAGGCFTENNHVWKSDGSLIKISELIKGDEIAGFNNDKQKHSIEDVTYYRNNSIKECLRIETNTGRTIECSTDHPIWWSKLGLNKAKELPKIDGRRRKKNFKQVEIRNADEINVGEQIAVLNEFPVFSNKEMWNPRLVGWLVGDGSYGFNKTPILSNCESEINSWVHDKCDYVTEKTYITKLGETYEENRIKGICPKLRELGIYGQTKSDKTLPKDIHSYSKNTISEFIGGFFDADGYVSDKGVISLSSGHKSILLEMQLLLQKFGIHGNINFKKPNLNNPKSKNGHYELEMKDKDSVLRFADNIKLYPHEKQYRLDSFYELYKNVKSQNADHLSGMRFERVVSIENIGMNKVYNLTANTTHTYIGNGVITCNTGGTEGANFAGSEKLFYNPEGYNIYGLPNRYDKNSNGSTKCGFFWPGYINRARCYNENGESDVIKALCEILLDRHTVKYGSSDPNAITQKKAEEPIVPQEAVMRTEGTIFPISDLKDYLSDISPDLKRFVSSHYVGRIGMNVNGVVDWKLTDEKTPIRDFPLKDNINREGAVELFEMPHKRSDGTIDPWRYIAGIDPIDYDEGNYTNSLGSIFIFDMLKDRIVAEYTGRSKFANDFYDICLRLLKLYNAQANYENNLKGLFTYFDKQGELNLLCDTPKIMRDMEMVKGDLIGNRSKGTPAGKNINAWARKLQADWQMTKAVGTEDVDEDGEVVAGSGKLNLQTIRSVAYLKECIAWNPDINADRVSAMGMLMIYREDRAKIELRETEDRIKTIYEDPWFNRFQSKGKKRF